MDIPYALQDFLSADAGVQANVRQGFSWPSDAPYGVFLLELDESMDTVMPIECVVLRASGGPPTYGSGTLELNDQRLGIFCYGATPHLAYNLYGAVYNALKNLTPSIHKSTYVHWAKPEVKGTNLRDPNLQWPYVLSSWQVLASDLTIS
jgi:hypothetical protein